MTEQKSDKTPAKKPARPAKPALHPDTIPAELRRLRQWVLWRYEWVNKEWTKPPCQTNGRPASSTNSQTWADFNTARRAMPTGKFDGVGFAVTASDPYSAFDFDHCRDGDGRVNERVADYVSRLASYTEITPSGTGLRVWVRAKLPPGSRKKGDFEAYETGRFFTVTGNRVPGTAGTIEERQAEVVSVWKDIFEDTTALPATNPPDLADKETQKTTQTTEAGAQGKTRFGRLMDGDWRGAGYASQSEGDMALVSMLARMSPDPARIDALFRKSGLMRPKWDERHGRGTYGQITIGKAFPTNKKSGAGRHEFRTLTTREMLEKYGVDEPPWLVEDWLPDASCGLVVSPPGGYKTWTLLNLAFAVSTGRPFLGRYPVTGKGSVLCVQQEDPFRMMLGRIARMFNPGPPVDGVGPDAVHELDCRFTEEFLNMPVHWHEARELNIEDRGSMDALEAKISELQPKLVIIDPLYSAASTKEYMALGAQAMLSLKRLRDKYGTSFAVGHHTTVAGERSEERSSIWGSQFLNAWTEWGWRLAGTDDINAVKVIRHFKGSETPKKLMLRFRITDWSFDVEIDERVDESISDRIEEAILEGVRFKTERALAEAVGCSPYGAHRAIGKMGLTKDDEGCYKIPSK